MKILIIFIKGLAINGWGISEVSDHKGGNLDGALAKSDMHLLYAPDRDEERSDEESWRKKASGKPPFVVHLILLADVRLPNISY